MTDEQQVRALLALAAELPDEVRPPVKRLLDQARRKRAIRAALCVASAAAVLAAGVAAPTLIRALSAGHAGPIATKPLTGLFPPRPQPPTPGPSAAQLARFRWSALPPSPLGPRSQPILTWTGKEVVELGGADPAGRGSLTGAAFSPTTRSWHMIASVPSTMDFNGAVSVWAGRQLFLTSGRVAEFWPVGTGAPAFLYNPASNRWTTKDLPVQLLGATQLTATWTGRVIVVAAVVRGRIEAAAYDPGTARWRMISPTVPAGHLTVAVAAVSAGQRVIVWSLWSRSKRISKTSGEVFSGIDVLALTPGGRWANVTGHWPQHTVVEGPISDGAGRILIPPGQIWCGICSHPGFYYRAQLADASSLALKPLPEDPLVAHTGIEPPIWLWNGATILAANISTSGPWSSIVQALSQMAAFDPVSNRWHTLPVPAGHPPMAANPLWAGSDLLMLTATGNLLGFHR